MTEMFDCRQAAGGAIRTLRQRREMSIQELADMSGVSSMGISYLERGMRKVRKGTARKVEQALSLPDGTYRRLLVAADADAELQSILATTNQVTVAVVGGKASPGRSPSALLQSYAAAQIELLDVLLLARSPGSSEPDVDATEHWLARCVLAMGLTADSWRVCATSDASAAGALLDYLEDFEVTRRALTGRLSEASAGAVLDLACADTGLPDAVVARLFGVSAEELWSWRCGGAAIPAAALELVHAFTAERQPARAS
jgi:transcriptional regulator with XRE-family HTH domain